MIHMVLDQSLYGMHRTAVLNLLLLRARHVYAAAWHQAS